MLFPADDVETDLPPVEGVARVSLEGPANGEELTEEPSVVYPLRIRAVVERGSCDGEEGRGRRDVFGEFGMRVTPKVEKWVGEL